MKHYPNGSFIATKSRIQIPISIAPIAAGDPAEEISDYELLDVNELITGGREGFVSYRVTGDSMREDIRPGYWVFVDPYCQPKSGDTIASRINGCISIKIFKRHPGDGLYLVSANKKYKPRKVTKLDNFEILGVVRAHLAVY